MDKLTEKILRSELADWILENGTRNKNIDGIQFGQYIWSKYKWDGRESDLSDNLKLNNPSVSYLNIKNQL